MAWVSDFFEVSLHKIRVKDIDPNFEVSHHFRTRTEYEQLMTDLKEVQRLLREKDYTREDFQRFLRSSNPYEQRLGKAYELFYQEHPRCIKLEWQRDHYEVIEGHHRLAVAQQMAPQIAPLKIPAKVYAPDRETLQRLRIEEMELERQPGRDRSEIHDAHTSPKKEETTPSKSLLQRNHQPIWERHGHTHRTELERLR